MQLIPGTLKKYDVALALIDYDVLRYELGSVTFDHPLGPELGKVKAPDSHIEMLVDLRIQEILDATNAEDYICYVTGPGNFRFDIAQQEPYKGNRDNVEKPEGWTAVDNHGRKKYNYTVVTGTEADDELGIIQRRYNQSGITTVICSRDKDLRMVEGLHFSWGCGERQPAKPMRYISYLDGMNFFFQQLLTGDSVDNIMGCGAREDAVYKSGAKIGQAYRRRKGVGPKEAITLLAQGECLQSWYDIVRHSYIKRFGPELADTILLENARLLYIGQASKDDMFTWDRIGIKDAAIVNVIQEEQEQLSTGVDVESTGGHPDGDIREEGGSDAVEIDELLSQESWPF